MKNVADLMSKCWRMFLEGRTTELLGARGLFGEDKLTKCFPCTYFTLQDGIQFGASEFESYLKEKGVYKVQDVSDRCALNGGAYAKGIAV